MQLPATSQPSNEPGVTFGDLVAAAFDQARTVSAEPNRIAELATMAVAQNLMRSPDNAAAARLIRRSSREWRRDAS